VGSRIGICPPGAREDGGGALIGKGRKDSKGVSKKENKRREDEEL